MIKNCPNCGKKLKLNHFKNEWVCPQTRGKKERRFGCGYVNKPRQKEL